MVAFLSILFALIGNLALYRDTGSYPVLFLNSFIMIFAINFGYERGKWSMYYRICSFIKEQGYKIEDKDGTFILKRLGDENKKGD